MTEIQTSTAGWQDQLSAIASGFLGDWLESRDNGLAVPMQLRQGNTVLNPEAPTVAEPRSTVVVLIHGLTELETIWDYRGQPGHHYGTDLAPQMDANALTLRYNSGRPIWRNGQDLADVLEALINHWPVPLKNLVLIGHSMGGLMIRSACHFGQMANQQWTQAVDSCVYLGSPHDGSWLARAAHGTADRLSAMPRDYLRIIGEFIDLRSAGIRNLSRGEILEKAETLPPLLPNSKHYAVAGLLLRNTDNPINTLFGDALVQESSARGAERPGWHLTDFACFPGIDHIRLTHDQRVYQQLEAWLT